MPMTTRATCNMKAGPLPNVLFSHENMERFTPTMAKKMDRKPVIKKKKPKMVRIVLVFVDMMQ